jgi:ubiquinone/menaquinone biosynthesis C-methylase UbiE
VAKNLSRSPTSASMDALYAAIHRQMTADDEAALQRPTAQEFADALRDHRIPADGTALDAGCGGTLSLSTACAEHGFRHVVAIDQNEISLEHAAAVARESGASAIHLSRGSVLRLPFADRTFEFAVCSGVAHHTADPERAIAELARVIKPRGRLYLSLYCFAGSPSELVVRLLRRLGVMIEFERAHRLFWSHRVINNFVLDHMYVPVLWLYKAAEVRDMIGGHGFDIEREWPSRMDPFVRFGALGRALSGDGLLRVWLCRRR